jgi:multidrug efflux pump
VRRLGVTARKQSPDLTLAVQFYSPDGSRDTFYLANYVSLQNPNRIARLPAWPMRIHSGARILHDAHLA